MAIAYLAEHDDAEHARCLVAAEGRPCVLFPGDLASEEQCVEVVHRSFSELGGLDVVVNNVAYQEPVQDFAGLTSEQWRRTFATNINKFLYATRAAVER